MSSELYNDIMESLREVREIRAGRLKPASVVEIPEPPKAVRTRLKLSQAEFAEFVGVNEYTLKNWEQGKRRISTPAKTLFKIVAAFPEVILKVRENELKAAKRTSPAESARHPASILQRRKCWGMLTYTRTHAQGALYRL